MRTLKLIFFFCVLICSFQAHAQFTTGGKTSGSINNDSFIHKGYKGFVDFGYGIGVGDYSAGRVEFSTAHGYQIVPYLFAGVGAGVNYFHDAESVNVPIFADIRGTLPINNSRVAPFLDLKIGYSVADVEGFYFSPSVGCRVAVSKKVGINLGIGYELQKVKIEYYGYGWGYEDNVNFGAVTIKLGVDF